MKLSKRPRNGSSYTTKFVSLVGKKKHLLGLYVITFSLKLNKQKRAENL